MTGRVFRQIWIAFIVLGVAAVVTASLWPMPADDLAGGADKFWHFLTYFVLALFSSGIVAAGRLWRLAVRCLLLGAGLEVAQALLTDTRQADWADMAANAAGILCAWVIASGGRAGWARHVEGWFLHRTER